MAFSYFAYLISFFFAISYAFIADLCFSYKRGFFEKLKSQITYAGKNKFTKKQYSLEIRELWGCFFLLMSMLSICLNASLRDAEVGADVKGYLLPAFDYAKTDGVGYFDLISKYGSWLENGYCLLVYWCAKHCNLHILFFLIQFISLLPLYISFINKRKKSKITYGVIIYCFLFYNFGLSATRQIIAMGYILCLFILIDECKYKAAVIVQIIAYSFHRSSLMIGIIILLIHLISNSKKRKQIFFLIDIFLVLIFIMYNTLMWKIANIMQLFNERYAAYIFSNTHSGFAWGDIMLSDFLAKTIITITAFLLIHWKTIKDPYAIKLMRLVFLGEYFTVFNANFYESTRIALYFHFFFILLIPYITENYIRKNFKSCLLVSFGFFMPLVLYWVYFIMWIGAYFTNNYQISV